MKRSQSDLNHPGSASTDGAALGNILSPMPIAPPRRDAADDRVPTWIDRESRVLPPLRQDPPQASIPSAKMTVDDSVAATDLQNPADALEFLANVAERDSGSNMLPPIQGFGRSRQSATSHVLNDSGRRSEQPQSSDAVDYPPLARGLITFQMIQTLLER